MKKKFLKPRGSILIWTILLGILLTTAFFFFVQRLNLNSVLQANLLKKQQAEVFLNSYADYLQSLPQEDLKMLSSEINYEDMVGTLSQNLDQIKGGLDANQSISYEVSEGQAKVEWGLCARGEIGFELEIEPSEAKKSLNCATAYDQSTLTPSDVAFTLTTGEFPVSYKITPVGQAILHDTSWHLDLALKLDSENTLTVTRNFQAKPD